MHPEIHFLCPTHRKWVEANPEQARGYINDILYNGSELIKQERYQDALPHMGCAMEAIGILDTLSAKPDPELLALLPSVANSLALCFTEIEQSDMVGIIAEQAKQLMEHASERLDSGCGVPVWLYNAFSELEGLDSFAASLKAKQWQYAVGSVSINH